MLGKPRSNRLRTKAVVTDCNGHPPSELPPNIWPRKCVYALRYFENKTCKIFTTLREKKFLCRSNCKEAVSVTFLHVLFFRHCVADFAADRCECQAALIAHSCPLSPSRAPTQLGRWWCRRGSQWAQTKSGEKEGARFFCDTGLTVEIYLLSDHLNGI